MNPNPLSISSRAIVPFGIPVPLRPRTQRAISSAGISASLGSYMPEVKGRVDFSWRRRDDLPRLFLILVVRVVLVIIFVILIVISMTDDEDNDEDDSDDED